MLRIGIDVGGTFTDVTALDTVTGQFHIHKLPSTTDDQSVAVADGYRAVLGLAGADAADVGYLGHEFISNPPPSSGGLLIGYGLRLLDRIGTAGPPGSAAAVAQIAEVMRETTRARGGRFPTDLHRGGAAKRIFRT